MTETRISLTDLKAKAIEAREISRAARAALGVNDGSEAWMRTWKALPVDYAEHAGIQVCVIIPQNRAAFRRPHYRYQYRINGRRASEAEVIAALGRA